jgi:hypothetical protein
MGRQLFYDHEDLMLRNHYSLRPPHNQEGPTGVRRGRVIRGLMAAAAVGVMALLPAGAASAHAVRPAGHLNRYVALGDSYAAGAGTATGPTTGPPGCLRSDDDYPHLVARALGLSLTDVTCSGATTADMAGGQLQAQGWVAPQLRSVTASAGLVTLTVGGNDLGLVTMVEHCAAATPWGPTAEGRTCAGYYEPTVPGLLTTIRGRIEGVLAAVHRRAPDARVLVVGYPDILPATGEGCWPRLPFTRADVPYLRGVEQGLDRTLAAAAAAGGARYVDTATPSVGHDACQAESARWVEPLVPESPALPFHPNRVGEAGMATAVVAALRAG